MRYSSNMDLATNTPVAARGTHSGASRPMESHAAARTLH